MDFGQFISVTWLNLLRWLGFGQTPPPPAPPPVGTAAQLCFLPMVLEGGTMGQQMDFFFSSFFSFSSFSSSFTPPNLFSPRYRKHQFLNWFDFPGNSSDSYLFLLLLLLFLGVFLSWRTVHSCPENCPQTPGSPVTPIALQYNPALGWIYNWLRSGSQIKASPGLFEENRQYSQYKSEFQNNIANRKIQVLTLQTYN